MVKSSFMLLWSLYFLSLHLHPTLKTNVGCVKLYCLCWPFVKWGLYWWEAWGVSCEMDPVLLPFKWWLWKLPRRWDAPCSSAWAWCCGHCSPARSWEQPRRTLQLKIHFWTLRELQSKIHKSSTETVQDYTGRKSISPPNWGIDKSPAWQYFL